MMLKLKLQGWRSSSPWRNKISASIFQTGFPRMKNHLSIFSSFLFHPNLLWWQRHWDESKKEEGGKHAKKLGQLPESKTHLHQIFSLTPKSTQKTRSCQARKWRIKKCCSTCSSIRFFYKGEVVNSSKNALRRLLYGELPRERLLLLQSLAGKVRL